MSRHKSLERFCSVVALCLFLTGCKTVKQTVEVPVYVHDTTQIVREVHDSTYIDRWHTVYQKDDTVYMHDSIYVTHWKIRNDTVYCSIEKPIPVTNTETVEVEKPLTWWQKTKQKGFWFLSAVVFIYIIWKTKKWWLPLLK